VLLAIDLGSTVTKAVVWASDGPRGVGRATLTTDRRAGGLAEQDPADWWKSVTSACRQAIENAGGDATRSIVGVTFAAARQTFVPVDGDLMPLRPGVMWSDRRATVEAAEIADRCGGTDALRRRTGAILDSASPAAKLAWLERHEPSLSGQARWILAPRDYVVARMTGNVATDETLAQSSGLYDAALEPVPELVGRWVDLLAPILPPGGVAGTLRDEAAGELILRSGIPVVIGAGDRACKVLGTGAGRERPMVSWGTTANVSVPVGEWPDAPGLGVAMSRGAMGGFLIEAGMSSAGSFMEWLAGIGGGTSVDSLLQLAGESGPGARGVTAVSWLGGARAPWWHDDARAAFFALAPEHTIGDMARAVVEAVAFEADRCIRAVSGAVGTEPTAMALAGGSGLELWPEVLAAVTRLPGSRRPSGLAACAGAALVAGAATGVELDLDTIDPPGPVIDVDDDLAAVYETLRSTAQVAAAAALGFAGGMITS